MTRCILIYLLVATFTTLTHAQMLEDLNGDERVEILAFGDSITRGVGDFIAAGEEVIAIRGLPEGEAGYPLRIENLLNISVQNRGFPGERLHSAGVFRFAGTLRQSNADYIVISEGANDAFSLLSPGDIERSIQAMINISLAEGRQPVLMTIPPTCCRHAGLYLAIEQYNETFRNLASLNNIPIADVENAYKQTCDIGECYLLNLPEGLHPNISGYDVAGETVIAALLGIDLLAPGGGTLLAQALNIDPSSIETVSRPSLETPQ